LFLKQIPNVFSIFGPVFFEDCHKISLRLMVAELFNCVVSVTLHVCLYCADAGVEKDLAFDHFIFEHFFFSLNLFTQIVYLTFLRVNLFLNYHHVLVMSVTPIVYFLLMLDS
jgi:hypothetical protein